MVVRHQAACCDQCIVGSHSGCQPEKRQFSVQRKIGVFLKGLNDAKRLRKKLTLKVQAGNFRDSFPAEVPWEIACLFCHSAPDFQRVLTPHQWAEVLKRFFRGQFDAELTEKVSHKDPNLTVASFRFLQMFGAKLKDTNPSTQQAARDEAMAAKEQEQADVDLAGRRLKREVAKWTTYNEAVDMWRSKNELQKRVLLTGREGSEEPEAH